MSIESQLTTLQRTFVGRPDIEIVGVYEESFSAKAPGRQRFNEMLTRIERGEAQGIIAWAPDRLARNSIDGGRVVYLLDCGTVSDLKFATYTFENNPQGKFMLQIMFGQSKYYSDALSENVKRGNRTKVDKGWRPNMAPLGYLNDQATKTIVPDPVHFSLIRQMFKLVLTGAYTPKQVATIARDQWGFRTPARRRSGGVPLAMSSIYRILSNPFYAGIIIWNGQTYPGRHEPVVSIAEFDRVRTLLSRSCQPRPHTRFFAFTGMIRCESCGLWVTAEQKTNRQGHQYVYYHCTKRKFGERCSEPSLELRSLEWQIMTFLRTMQIEPSIEAWLLGELAEEAEKDRATDTARNTSIEQALKETGKQLNELTSLRLRLLIADSEFLERRSALQQEQLRLRETAEFDKKPNAWLEPASEVISFSNRAAEWFRHGDDTTKRQILQTVHSNLTLRNRILNIEAAKPFAVASELSLYPSLLGVDDKTRTRGFGRKSPPKNFLKEFRAALCNPDTDRIIENIRALRMKIEPAAAHATKASSRSRQVRDA